MSEHELRLFGDKLAGLIVSATSLEVGLTQVRDTIIPILEDRGIKGTQLESLKTLVATRVNLAENLIASLKRMLDGINKLYLSALEDGLPGRIDLGRPGINGQEYGGEA